MYPAAHRMIFLYLLWILLKHFYMKSEIEGGVDRAVLSDSFLGMRSGAKNSR